MRKLDHGLDGFGRDATRPKGDALAAIQRDWLAYWDITQPSADLEALANQIAYANEFIDPGDESSILELQSRRMWVEYLRGNWPKAEKLVLICLKEHSNNAKHLAQIYVLHGLLLVSRNQLDEAQTCFKKARQYDRWNELGTWGAIKSAGQAWYQAKQLKYKVNACKQYISAVNHGLFAGAVWAGSAIMSKLKPQSNHPRYELGKVWVRNVAKRFSTQWHVMRLGHKVSRSDRFIEAHTCCPGEASYSLQLAESCFQQGAFDSAWLWLQQVIQRHPTNEAAHWKLAELLIAQGRVDEAQAVYRLLIELCPTNPMVHIHLGNLYAQQDNIAGAANHFKAALNSTNHIGLQDHWRGWVARSLGDLYSQHYQIDAAQAAYQLAYQLNSNDIESGIALSLTYIEQTDLGNARLLLEDMMHRGLTDARVYSNLGYLLWLSDLPEQSQVAYEKALDLDRNDPLPFNNLGVLWLDAKGQGEQAIPYFEKAIALDPDYTLAYYNLGRAQSLVGQTNTALLNLQKAKHLNTVSQDLDPADISAKIEQAIDVGLRPMEPSDAALFNDMPWDLQAKG